MPRLFAGRMTGPWRYARVWKNSPKDSNGQILYKTNPHSREYYKLVYRTANFGNAFCSWGIYPLNSKNAAMKAPMAQLYGKCYNRLRDKIWNDSQVLIAVDTAERNKTLSMIAKNFLKLADAARALKRGRYKTAASILALDRVPTAVRRQKRRRKKKGSWGRPEVARPMKDLAALWLEYRYGWLPLYYSIHGLMQDLDLPPDPFWMESRARVYPKLDWNETYFQHSYECWVRGHAKAKVKVTNPSLATLQRYGLLNPALVAWELVPFSFVLDWVLPIGSYLENLTAFSGLGLSDISYTTAQRQKQTVYRLSGGKRTGEFCVNTLDQKERVVWASLPRPSHPLFSNGINPKRALDSIALYLSVFGRAR